MEIGQIVRLRIMPEEQWEVIQQQGNQFCLMNLEEPRMAIWARDSEVGIDRNATVEKAIKTNESHILFVDGL